MKKLKELGMAFIAIIACISMAACSNKIDVPVADDEQEVYTVKIGWSGEILDIKDEPLSRATTNNLYGIQVYSTPDKELEEGKEVVWTPYAYGLFDDPVGISINLLKGYKYKFVSTMVVDGKNKILHSLDTDEVAHFYSPFSVTPYGSGTISNVFEYSGTSYLYSLNSYLIQLIDGPQYEYPNIDRYYGELIGFNPISDEKSANIPMKRVSFGASFVAINSIAKDGTLEIQLKNAPKMEIDFTAGELNEFWAKDIYSFKGVTKAYAKDDYTETIPVTINWHRADGATVSLGTHDITYKRNRNTIVTVKITNAGTDSDLGFSIDESEQTDIEDMEKGDDVTIENGEIEESVVAVNKTVTIETAGTLSTLITEEEKYKITSLTISGPLNGDDIAFLRDIMSINNEEVIRGKIIELDLNNASIVEGGAPYRGDAYFTQNNIIGTGMFASCGELQKISIPNSINKIGNNAFTNCYSLTSISIGNNVTTIGDDVFSYCKSLTSVIIPDGVTYIGRGAWRFSGLTSITIPKNVTTIYSNIFEGCSNLMSIIVEESNTKYDSRNDCNAIIETNTNHLVVGCKKTIIPADIIKIGEEAFKGCDALTSIFIPNSVRYIGDRAFDGCCNLAAIHCEAVVPPTFAIGSYYFRDVPSSCTLYVPTGSKSAYEASDYWGDFINIQEE